MDVETGLALAEEHNPDVILLDLHMPVLSGIDAARWIRAHDELKYTPLIALTADSRELIRDEALMALPAETYQQRQTITNHSANDPLR